MNKLNINNLIEAGSFSTPKERLLKKALLELLVAKKHIQYAKRLALLDVVIVPLKEDPDMTAAISFETGTVYISEGFLDCGPATFNQLDVLMRHELAHNLLMHQVRMLHKFMEVFQVDEETAQHIMRSSLHGILNIIEDFEISNTRYTQTDKLIVKNLLLNGRVISGLVTEDSRPSWQNMSLTQMYDELTKELESAQAQILQDPAWEPDFVNSRGLEPTKAYTSIDLNTANSIINLPLDQFINTSTFKSLSAFFKNMVLKMMRAYKEYTQQELETLIKDIQQTSTFKAYEFKNKAGESIGVTAYTPEDKTWGINILLALAGKFKNVQQELSTSATSAVKKEADDFVEAYNKIIKYFDNNKYDSNLLAALRRYIMQLEVNVSNFSGGTGVVNGNAN